MFKDHFSAQSADYGRYRPRYPDELLAFIASSAPGRSLALDVGCGTGQAAAGLAAHFELVLASDASAAQLAQARQVARVAYLRHRAERLPVRGAAADLIVVAQAAHWLDLPRFYAEARRVLKARGALALFGYQIFRVDAAVDAIVDDFYASVVGPYWPPERALVEAGYRTLPFPFRELGSPAFAAQFDWPLAAALGYIGTWSAVARFRAARQDDPLPALATELEAHWGEGLRRVRFPMHLRIGTV